MSIRRLVSQSEINKAADAFRSVFQSHDPFGEPFQSSIAFRGLLYPATYFPAGYELYAMHYRAIVSAASAIGGAYMYVSEVEGMKNRDWFHGAKFHGVVQDFNLSPEAVALQLRNEGYIPSIETAIYSSDGQWGMITSHENHALIGGTERFMSKLSQHLDLESGVPGFLDYWKDVHQRLAVDIAWIPKLLHHVYGREKAVQYFTAAHFPVVSD